LSGTQVDEKQWAALVAGAVFIREMVAVIADHMAAIRMECRREMVRLHKSGGEPVRPGQVVCRVDAVRAAAARAEGLRGSAELAAWARVFAAEDGQECASARHWRWAGAFMRLCREQGVRPSLAAFEREQRGEW
jgi:hypothetical protein